MGAEVIASLRKPGGILVLDDMMWGRALELDPVRSFWLQQPRLVATEVMAGQPDWAAIICVGKEI